MAKREKGNWAERGEDVFPEEMLRDLDEMLRSQPAVVPKRPAGPTSPQPPARPAAAPPPQMKGDPANRRKAQELAAQAKNMPDRKKAGRLSRQSLELDRNCVDALVVLAHAKATAPDELAEGLERAVERGEAGLGRECFEYYRGKFWTLPEARPYMQARRELADVLRDMGRLDPAVRHYEALLELDSGDTLRIRDSLVTCYLAAGYLEGAKRLLDQFARDASATMAWLRVMERFLAGDLAGAAAALTRARQSNALVEDYLTGKKPMPQYTLSDSVQGGDYEARHCAATLLPALVQHPRFAVWLGAQAVAP